MDLKTIRATAQTLVDQLDEMMVGPGDDAAEGPRLIALNMALNGAPRGKTRRYLADNYPGLADVAGLVESVYDSVT